MSALPRLKVWLICSSFVVLSVGAVTLAQGPKRAAQPEAQASYVRAIEGDRSTRAVLEDLGTSWVEFEYRLPAESKAIFTFVATGKNGEIIKSLSKVNEVVAGDGENTGTVRLTYINPAGFTEGYNGKVRWVKTVGGSGWGSEWMEDQYKLSGARSSWTSGKSVDDPKLGAEYDLWSIRAYPKGLTRLLPDSPTTFKFQISFRYERVGANDSRSTNSEVDFEPRAKE